MIGARARAPELVTCAGCGASFRAEYTRGLCPICDRAVEESVPPPDRLAALPARLRGPARAVLERWPLALVGVAVVGNIAILVVVTVSTSGR